MSKIRNKNGNASIASNIERFRRKVTDLKSSGYVPLRKSGRAVKAGSFTPSGDMTTDDIKEMYADGKIYNRATSIAIDAFDEQRYRTVATPKDANGNEIGTPSLGYVPWGLHDRLPLEIYQAARMLPYTAAGIRFLVEMTVGLGPQYMYRWTSIVGGTVSEQLIPFEHAGMLLRYKIAQLREAINNDDDNDNDNREDDNPINRIIENPMNRQIDESANRSIDNSTERSIDESATGIEPQSYRTKKSADPAEADPYMLRTYDDVGTNEDELRRAKDEYREWERTRDMHLTFTDHNNLNLHYQKCANDDWHLDIFFPTIGLSQGKPGEWDPRIVKVGYVPAVCARFEEADLFMRHNYVYYSENFRTTYRTAFTKGQMVAYPVVYPDDMVGELRTFVDKQKHAAVKDRTLWYTCPTQVPSCYTAVYPHPAWWSIFSCFVYQYASTLMLDKAIARQNSVMAKYMIFIDDGWLQSLYEAEGATGDAEKEDAIRDEILADVESFLSKKQNNGKTITASKYVGQDGKTEHRAVEIVELPEATSAATKDELEEISSIIFFAIGVDPRLIGAVPGKNTSSSGTQSRELYLLKQIQVSPRQRNYLRFLNDIYRFNKATRKGVWVIGKEVLTTLDASKTGTKETTAA